MHQQQDYDLERNELFEAYQALDFENLLQIYSSIDRLIDLTQDKKPTIKRGVFDDLDELRDQYEDLTNLMSFKLQELREDVEGLPEFMHKIRMIMIPSAGYFVSVSKCD